jgi:hypothetical protein
MHRNVSMSVYLVTDRAQHLLQIAPSRLKTIRIDR